MTTPDFLAKLPIFQELPISTISRLLQRSAPQEFAPGELIVKQGAQADSCFVILRGAAEVRRNLKTPGESHVVLKTLGMGDIFGEISIVDGHARSADVIALSPTTCQVLPASLLQELVREHPTFANRILSLTVTRLWEMEQQAGG